jgi:phosphatidylglycerol:prolipoprotein diacylglycerol transferase
MLLLWKTGIWDLGTEGINKHMFTISISPIIFTIGHFHLRWYGLIVVTAIWVGLWVAAREAKRKGFAEEEFYNIALWIIFAGMIGARLFHVIDHWPDEFAANPIRALFIWEGGLAIWGGVLAGLVTTAIIAKIKAWKLSRLLDALVPAVVLGQAIGRFACIITGDSVGKPTTGPFGFAYTSPEAMVPKLGVYYTPTPVFEILMNLGIFTLLWNLRKKNLPDGVLALIYLSLYSIGRFVITFWSSYKEVAFGLNQAQLISIAVLLVTLPWLGLIAHRWESKRLAEAQS